MDFNLRVLFAVTLLGGCAHRAPPPNVELPPGTNVPNQPSGTSAPVAAAPAAPVIASLPRGPVSEDADDGVLGPHTARFSILEFSDLECPFCGPSYGALAAYVKAHDDVRLVMKHYPISGLCNPNVEGNRHEHACAAALAVICASKQEKFDALAGLIFANQGTLADADLQGFEQQAGVYGPAFVSCLAAPETGAALASDIHQATAAKVEGTPTIYVSGPWGARWIQIHGGAPLVIQVLDAARQHQPLPEISGGAAI